MRNQWRGIGRALAGMALLLAMIVPAHAVSHVRRVLFVGNSLTYMNNLPAAFASLTPKGMDVRVDGFARPGARLQDDIGNATLERLLARGRYTDVVFQERGGDAICGFDAAECRASAGHSATLGASVTLANAARAGGARVFYLGTYQQAPKVVPWLLFGEHLVARRMGAVYIELGGTWERARKQYPHARWLATDGMHPGYATTALMALRTWRAVTGTSAKRIPCVTGTLFTKAPSTDGYFRVTGAGSPTVCLVDAKLASSLAHFP